MKSIVQEASSIAKAIEKSLEKASNPRDFSVKILEYPEKNFFGLTTKPAKIALYFDDKNRKPHDAHPLVASDKDESPRLRLREKPSAGNQARKQGDNSRKSQDSYVKSTAVRSSPFNNNRRMDEAPVAASESSSGTNSLVVSEGSKSKGLEGRDSLASKQRSEESVVRWNSDIVHYAKEWLTRVLTEMHHLVPFELSVDRFHIKITLERPLFEDPEQERRVLASLSLLMLETCKHKFKVNLRDHRVILTHRNS